MTQAIRQPPCPTITIKIAEEKQFICEINTKQLELANKYGVTIETVKNIYEELTKVYRLHPGP